MINKTDFNEKLSKDLAALSSDLGAIKVLVSEVDKELEDLVTNYYNDDKAFRVHLDNLIETRCDLHETIGRLRATALYHRSLS